VTQTPYDQTGDARRAVRGIYQDFGAAGLDNVAILDQRLRDVAMTAPREASVLLRAGGWTPIAHWTDDEELFSVILANKGATQSDDIVKSSQGDVAERSQ
jgi:hypothetical protein